MKRLVEFEAIVTKALPAQLLNSSCHRDKVSGCACAELRELKQHYESALRAWGQHEFPLHNEPVATRARRSDRLQRKQTALDARNAANDSVLDHRRVCPLCAEGRGHAG
jgi:hypothetical protein